MHTCMATKTISIDLEAYERLCRARRSRTESFSRVIKRARWEPPATSCASFLGAISALQAMDREALDRLDAAQHGDEAPGDPWTR
jgi:hypothetical protein